MKDKLIHKIHSKQAVIGIVGLGYVGLPLMLRFAEIGFDVLGFDIDYEKTAKLKSGLSYIKHIPDERINNSLDRLDVTNDYNRISEVDAIIICVPTPLNSHREPNLGFVIATIDAIVPQLRRGQIISLESTTYPGTTEEELLPRISLTNLKIGEDLFLVYSPEREDPGNTYFTTGSIPKVCGGITKHCLEVGIALYSAATVRVVPVSSTRTAEMTKLLENIHRAVNIGLVNELKIVADAMGIDIYEVIDAASTKPFGFTPYYPGPGLGGHCIPIDPFYLTWKARQYELNTRFIELAGEINTSMPDWVIGKVADALNEKGKSVNGSKILVLGLSYKKNIDDTRESPSIFIIDKLIKKGAKIDYSDPFIPVFPETRKLKLSLSSVELTSENLTSYDCIILATNHDMFDYDLIRRCAALIIDTRRVYRNKAENIYWA
ncbi:udp-glucose/gdp-mannose dehydrogenase dimerisation [Lucifera butyrica]|uniref:Udp-glucose/gdp-mannose dehydrogenase dimerisation n=1 Tax=Lucifera butyrica TaxID=1351585 RepID=A0A498RKL6_9FIRM|nr:nucleotide sugar dehydrogenase [Lucifera butyrica]VBB09598.1 udp-glucose/gdp-mannose dehydrogenase dimerisation [Lucifera butyrica]